MTLFPFAQRIRLTVDENEQKQLRDLEVAMWSNDCPFIVQFYGATLKEVSVHLGIATNGAYTMHIGALSRCQAGHFIERTDFNGGRKVGLYSTLCRTLKSQPHMERGLWVGGEVVYYNH